MSSSSSLVFTSRSYVPSEFSDGGVSDSEELFVDLSQLSLDTDRGGSTSISSATSKSRLYSSSSFDLTEVQAESSSHCLPIAILQKSSPPPETVTITANFEDSFANDEDAEDINLTESTDMAEVIAFIDVVSEELEDVAKQMEEDEERLILP